MKVICITILAIFSLTHLFSQSIALPVYQQGQYEVDTIYSYYGPLPSSGIGRVYLSGALASAGFVTGVDFKVVVDSTNQGLSPSHAAFVDSLGAAMVRVYAGDTIPMPVTFQLLAGYIGFHVIIEGTPSIAGESYLCDLGYLFTTGNDWEMLISENSQNTCLVDQIQGLSETTITSDITIYPNPFQQSTTIEFDETLTQPFDFVLYNILGKEVRRIKDITTNKLWLEKADLHLGTYIFQIQTTQSVLASGKLMIE